MRRGTTPTHEFELPFETNAIKKIIITYAQRDEIVLEKKTEDCKMDGTIVSVTLTQEETLRLDSSKHVKIQAKILLFNGKALVSNKITKAVSDVLNEEVMI